MTLFFMALASCALAKTSPTDPPTAYTKLEYFIHWSR